MAFDPAPPHFRKIMLQISFKSQGIVMRMMIGVKVRELDNDGGDD